MKSIDNLLIAPCGMNCSICMAYLRERNKCCGCRGSNANKPKTRINCKIKNCDFFGTSGAQYCFECENYPCKILKHLDIRYRTKYKMSVIENLENIRKYGLTTFLEEEQEKWKCQFCGGVICVHKGVCIDCGKKK
jgi:hypothetical protein